MIKRLKNIQKALLVVLGIEFIIFFGGRMMAPPFLETLHQKQNHQLSYLQLQTISDPIAVDGNASFYLVSDDHYMYVVKSRQKLNIDDKLYGYSVLFNPQLKQMTLESLNTLAEVQVVTPETFDETVGLYYLDTTLSPWLFILTLTGACLLGVTIYLFVKSKVSTNLL